MQPNESTISPLEKWLEENADGISLQQLAFSSGFHFEHLRLIALGLATPNEAHIQALRRIIPNLPTALLDSHRAAIPDSLATKRGSVPAGCKLTIIPVSEIQVGDWISYIPTSLSARGKSHWVQVLSVIQSDRVAKVVFYELQLSNVPNPIKLTGTNPVRTARINASDTDNAGIERG